MIFLQNRVGNLSIIAGFNNKSKYRTVFPVLKLILHLLCCYFGIYSEVIEPLLSTRVNQVYWIAVNGSCEIRLHPYERAFINLLRNKNMNSYKYNQIYTVTTLKYFCSTAQSILVEVNWKKLLPSHDEAVVACGNPNGAMKCVFDCPELCRNNMLLVWSNFYRKSIKLWLIIKTKKRAITWWGSTYGAKFNDVLPSRQQVT